MRERDVIASRSDSCGLSIHVDLIHLACCKLLQKFFFVHAVLERFAAVDKDDGNFVGKLAAKTGIGIDVNLLPGEWARAEIAWSTTP